MPLAIAGRGWKKASSSSPARYAYFAIASYLMAVQLKVCKRFVCKFAAVAFFLPCGHFFGCERIAGAYMSPATCGRAGGRLRRCAGSCAELVVGMMPRHSSSSSSHPVKEKAQRPAGLLANSPGFFYLRANITPTIVLSSSTARPGMGPEATGKRKKSGNAYSAYSMSGACWKRGFQIKCNCAGHDDWEKWPEHHRFYRRLASTVCRLHSARASRLSAREAGSRKKTVP